MRIYLSTLLFIFLCACSSNTIRIEAPESYVGVAYKYIGYEQRANRAELKAFMGVDPVRVEWCAAFVNAALRESGYAVTQHTLLARSFLEYGNSVDELFVGDIVVLTRGTQDWQGHVGFFVGEQKINGVQYYALLSGNNEEAVNIDWYRASRVLGIRRPTSANLLEHQVRSLLEKIQDDQQSLQLGQSDQLQHNLPDSSS